MKVLCVLIALVGTASAEKVSPIQQVISMLQGMEGKIIEETKERNALFDEFTAASEAQHRELVHSIKVDKADIEENSAGVAESKARLQELGAKIEDLTSAINKNEADLAAATKIRGEENAVFIETKKELLEILDTLSRATAIIEKEMAKGGASMLQMQNAESLVDALQVLVQARSISQADGATLTNLLQNDDAAPGAPDAEVYKSHSGGIVDVLNGLTNKAQDQLDAATSAETKSLHDFELLAQSLTNKIDFANKELADAKANKAKTQGELEQFSSDLAAAKKSLAENTKAQADLHRRAMDAANRFEEESKTAQAEIGAIKAAVKVIKEKTGGAAAQRGFLFLQTESSSSSVDMFIRKLAQHQNDPAMMQLSSRIASMLRSGSGDQFGKVKDLIREMIEKLEKEAEDAADHKAWCDKETAETKEKLARTEAKTAKTQTAHEKATAAKASLEEQVADLQASLAALAKSQAEMDALRAKENAAFKKSAAELELGIEGVKEALKILRDFYGGQEDASQSEASKSVLTLLEVCLSDFEQGLAEATSEEDAAQRDYDDQTKENQIEKATKEQDVKYKSEEIVNLAAALQEHKADLESLNSEHTTLSEYMKELHDKCVPKVESYEETTRRRAAEIAGLKEALEILQPTALVQTGRSVLRGTIRH